jgi:mono/diheme cytochrome c family protein
MLKKLLTRVCLVLVTLAAVVAGLAAYVQVDGVPRYAPPPPDTRVATVTPALLARGEKLASMLCLDCHANAQTGKATGKFMAELPEEFGPVFSKNITKHPTKGIGGWTDGDLRIFLRTGLRANGTYAPPYMIKMPHVSDDDLDAIIAFLRSDDPRVAASDVEPPGETKPSFLVKALTHAVFKPLPYPTKPIVAPPKTDAVAYGRYLTVTLDCYGCHSASFTSTNVLEPEKSEGFMAGGNVFKAEGGKTLYSANLTPDPETGIGKWTEAEFVRALKQGFRPDGRVLHYPMEPKSGLDDEEAAAIYAYLRTVPKIKNAVRRPEAQPVVASTEGKALYASYGCSSCHGETGKGAVGDLRHANETYPSDAELRHWIDEAPSIRPGTKMPGWKGVIKEEHYPPLLAHVRTLSAENGQRTTQNP